MCPRCLSTWYAQRYAVLPMLTCAELCAGGGGTALGLEQAGFTHELLVDNDHDACSTLRANRPGWAVAEDSIDSLDGADLTGLDLISAGLPCTPHSRGGRQFGADDDRHLWDQALRIISAARPRAVMFETADAILSPKFSAERSLTRETLLGQGYGFLRWEPVSAVHFGVPQRRNRAVLIAFRARSGPFCWPEPSPGPPATAGSALHDLMAWRGWPGAAAWQAGAQYPAPTVSIGSRLHGGADLGPSQTKQAWRKLGVDGSGVADEAPGPDGLFLRGRDLIRDAGDSGPMLTVRMCARLQGFPDDWQFRGKKTSSARQVGNAFPPPVARTLGCAIRGVLEPA
jgi:DNA (cytosine-5)-methyltransferase 1